MYKWLLLLTAVLFMGGCGDSETANMHKRQDNAMKDPFNYSPYPESKTDISGGGLGEFNNNAFKRDVNSVLNP